MPPGVVGHCSACGFYFYRDMPTTHLMGCPRETEPREIQRHRLHEFGRALWELIAPLCGERLK